MARSESKLMRDRCVLTRSVLRAAELLDVPQCTLAHVLGVSPATVRRMRQDEYLLNPDRKEWDFALLFVRMFRSLDSIIAARRSDTRAWLYSHNRALQTRPIDMIVKVSGLVHVVDYLDAARTHG